jgi:drug/metabolite transporter (DMT)-like permease
MPEDTELQAGDPDGEAGPAAERGRDLALLALGIIIINEAIFTAYVLAQDRDALVAQAGRFALKAGMAYLTWQGFALSRWILVVLVAAAIIAAPWALADAYARGPLSFALILTATVAGYLVAGWLLALSADVSRFVRDRAELRNRDVFRG